MRTRIAILLWGLALSPVVAGESCPRTLGGIAAPTVVPADRSHVRISSALPTYQPTTEVLFHLYPDGHSVLYTAGYFFESNGVAPKPNERMISQGMTIRIKVGKDYVDRIVAHMNGGTMHQCRHSLNCHQRLFYLLGQSGIFPAAGHFVLGSTSLERLLESGFVDGTGRKFAQDVFVITDGTDHQKRIPKSIRRFELGGGKWDALSILGNAIGYPKAEMSTDIQAALNDPNAGAYVAMLVDPERYDDVPEPIQELAHRMLKRTEEKLLAKLEASSGHALAFHFEHLMEFGLGEHRPMVKALFRQCLQESTREMSAELFAQASGAK